MTDFSQLDNPAWHAINSLQRDVASQTDTAAKYAADVSPFGAVAEPGSLAGLEDLVMPGQVVALASTVTQMAPQTSGWTEMAVVPLFQMACTEPVIAGIELLGRELEGTDNQQMYDLAKLTDPGPFELNTWRMGRYFGVDGAELEAGRTDIVAMAGERFRMPGWVEISGVCSHPDTRGKGYAKSMVAQVMQGIFENDLAAFLHVRKGSPSEASAVALYERLGFFHHQDMVVQIFMRDE